MNTTDRLLSLRADLQEVRRLIADPHASAALSVATELIADAIESLELADPAEKAAHDERMHKMATTRLNLAFGHLPAHPAGCSFCTAPAVETGYRDGDVMSVCNAHRHHLTKERA